MGGSCVTPNNRWYLTTQETKLSILANMDKRI